MSKVSVNVQNSCYLRLEKLKKEKRNIEEELSFAWLMSDEEEISLRRELGTLKRSIARQERMNRQIL